MQKGYFISDLHLFANRSESSKHEAAIRRAASDAAVFVLGGDIFDFRWATTAAAEVAVRCAVEWLGELASHCPGCQFQYVLGNHDYHRGLLRGLDELDRTNANFSWHRFLLRLGENVFLHGDVADKRTDADSLAAARSRWLDDRRRGPLLATCYDIAVWARLHTPVPRIVYPHRVVTKRILAYLEAIGQGPRQGVKHVYFGHTHRVMTNYEYGGLVFHNGGAPIKGMEFQIIEAAVSTS